MFLTSAQACTVICLLVICAIGRPLKVTRRSLQGSGEIKNTVDVGTPPRSLALPRANDNAKQLVMYYQTHFRKNEKDEETEDLVDPLPLIGQITHLMLGAFHLNEGKPEAEKVTLNNHVPQDDYFKKLWPAMKEMQDKGVKVLGVLGSAAPGTFPMLSDEKWDEYYPALRKVITEYKLDGMDLDVEQKMPLQTIERIIEALKKDFGDKFIITLKTVASALHGKESRSGFNYLDLEKGRMKDKISFYNAQFYTGWEMFSVKNYVKVIEGGIDASKITATMWTDSQHGGFFLVLPQVRASLDP